MNMDLGAGPGPTPLAKSDWLEQPVTDSAGREGVVRRVFQVGTVQVGILTAVDCNPVGCPIWEEPLDLVARRGEVAAFPDFRQRVEEFGALELLVLHARATQAEADRYLALRDRLAPYSRAQTDLYSALIAQVRPGDRVATEAVRGTVLDPDPLPRFSVRLTFTMQLDAVHRDAGRPDGIVDLATFCLFPTLGLL